MTNSDDITYTECSEPTELYYRPCGDNEPHTVSLEIRPETRDADIDADIGSASNGGLRNMTEANGFDFRCPLVGVPTAEAANELLANVEVRGLIERVCDGWETQFVQMQGLRGILDDDATAALDELRDLLQSLTDHCAKVEEYDPGEFYCDAVDDIAAKMVAGADAHELAAELAAEAAQEAPAGSVIVLVDCDEWLERIANTARYNACPEPSVSKGFA